jgi:TetR/AcrR family transcriptional regulator, transcriptional repressor for nem operon
VREMSTRAEVSRQRIVEAAAELMAVQGYERTCLESLLERAGVSKGNFYHHFVSKEDLGLAVLEHLGTESHKFLREAMERREEPLDQLAAMFDALVTATTERECRGGCPLGNLAAEMSDANEAFRGQLARIFDGWRAMVEAALAEAARRSQRPAVDVGSLAHHIISSLEGSLLMAKLTREVGELANTVAHLKIYVRQQFTN